MYTKTKKIVKNHKLKISNIQNSTFVRTTEKKIQKKFVAFEVSVPIRSQVNENEKKNNENHKKPRGFDALLVNMADNGHIKLDNIQI